MRRFLTFMPAVVVLLTALTVLLAAPTALRKIGHSATAVRIDIAHQTLGEDDILERIDRAVSAIAEAIEPGVVHVDVSSSGSRASTTGSGWVLDKRGHIVTNSHVVRGADAVRVQFFDGRVVQAELIGADPFTDIAVLRVNTSDGLFPLTLARGRVPRKGERVYAFGSPFGFKFSMSEGIVSGLGRNPSGSLGFGGYTNFIQTDAAVNPGNSGGPLVDVRGQLVGMNVAIATGRDTQGTQDSGDSAGISFAIPVGTIEPIVSQIIEGGQVARGFVGVQFRESEDRVSLPDGSSVIGTRVTRVIDDGPAARAGLRADDVIVSIADYSVTGSQALQALISSSRPGAVIPMQVLRGDRLLPVQITLDEMPLSNMLDRIEGQVYRQLGVRVRTVYLENGGTGAAIMTVTEGSIASRLGLRPGQIVLSVDGRLIATRNDFLEAVYTGRLLNGGELPFVVVSSDESNATRATIRVRIYPR